MFIKLFLISLILFSICIFANEEEKLIIVPADNVPEDVKQATQAIGELKTIGFFINQHVFVSSISNITTASDFISQNILQFREATTQEVELSNALNKGDIVAVSAGKAELVKGRYTWGVFQVTPVEDKDRLFTETPTRFLKFSDFHIGDQIFILTNYHYDDVTVKKRRMIMKVSNSGIQNIVATINLEESTLLSFLRYALNGGIAVNQRGEAIGFLNLTDGQSRLVRFNSDILELFNEETQKIIRNNNQPLETETIKPVKEDTKQKTTEESKKRRSILQRCQAIFTR